MISHRVLHESHIAPGNYVRVIGGRDIHRVGHVMEIVMSMVQIREVLESPNTPIQPLRVAEGASITQADSNSVSLVH